MIGTVRQQLVKSQEKAKKANPKAQGGKNEESEKNKFNIFEGQQSQIDNHHKPQQSRFMESFQLSELVLSQNRQPLSMKLQKLSNEINGLKHERDSIKEEIQFLLLNFAYIIELANKNIKEGMNKKLEKVMTQKNKIILTQNQKLKYYEESQKKQTKMHNENAQLKEELKRNQLQYQKLIEENKLLKRVNAQLENKGLQKLQKYPPSTADEIELENTSMKELFRIRDSDITSFKVKKTRTNEEEHSLNKMPHANIKSLDKLKFSMNLLKEQLIHGIKKQ